MFLPNKYFLCALDDALSKDCGLSLVDLVASPRCKALDVHDERDSANDENSSVFRSVIRDMITKTSHLEVSRERDDGGAPLPPRILSPHWTLCCALVGPTRRSQDHDAGGLFLHRKFNDTQDAIVYAGCWICILEHAVVHSSPLSHEWSQAFYTSRNFLQNTRPRALCSHSSARMWYTRWGLPTIRVGSIEHLKMTWQKVKFVQSGATEATKVKRGCWQSTFNLQESSYLLVLLWVGFPEGLVPFQQMGVDDGAAQQCRHQRSLAASHFQQRPTRPPHRLALRLFLMRQLWPAAVNSVPVAVATVASKPSASGEKACRNVKQSKLMRRKMVFVLSLSGPS